MSFKNKKTPFADTSKTGIPAGFCQCGCGSVTTRLKYDDPLTGQISGAFKRFMQGHQHRFIRQQDPEWGKHSQRQKKIERVRKEIVEIAKRKPFLFTVYDMANAVRKHGFRVEGISRIAATARLLNDFSPLLKRKPTPLQYERKEIAYEFETEIAMLVDRYMTLCLDMPTEDGRSPYEACAQLCTNRTPLDDLIEKEEREENERFNKFFRIKKSEEKLNHFRVNWAPSAFSVFSESKTPAALTRQGLNE